MTPPVFDPQWLVKALEWLFAGYFLLLHGSHTLLGAVSVNSLRSRMESVAVKMLPRLSAGYEIPVSILVPVSERTTDLAETVKAMFGLDYPLFEIIVINDTGDEAVMAELQSAFDLVIFPQAYWRQVRTRRVHNVFRSPQFPGLRVIEKKPGGTGDAINAGVNAARYPIICIAQPDCILNRDSLRRLIPDFLDDASTVAVGTAERVANGSFIVNGFLERCRLAGNPLVWFQAGARLRRDLCTRHGWAGANAVLTFAERFCAFRKDAVVHAGGFARSAANPVIELVARLHRINAASEQRYRIAFLPAPVSWRIVPTTPAAVCKAAADEQYGLDQALEENRGLLSGGNTGMLGRLAIPYAKLTVIAGPAIEILAWLFFLGGFAFGVISLQHLIAFAVCAAGLGITVSWLAIFIDALVFRAYQYTGTYFLLLVYAIFENTGYRQLIALCTLRGIRRRPSSGDGEDS
jgi:cellulose synthase/poly-beta-1,6-N-acetylglucosamine synthase-like glycosyltransferase